LKNVVVLLSACINVNPDMAARSDAATRLNDYKVALGKWSRAKGFAGLVFCENSGAALEELKHVARTSEPPLHETEFLSFKSKELDPSLGKGIGELDTIRHALETSRLIADADLIIKITGRLFVRNIERLGKLLAAIPDIYVSCDLRHDLSFADSRVFCATPDFIRDYLLPRGILMNDAKGVFFEHVLARAVHAAIADGRNWTPLPAAHWMDGVSGTSNKKIPNGRINQLLRECFRAIKGACLKR
jgi:hypothetical protein